MGFQDSPSSDEEDDDEPKPQKTDKNVPNSVVTSEPIAAEVDDEEAYENMVKFIIELNHKVFIPN